MQKIRYGPVAALHCAKEPPKAVGSTHMWFFTYTCWWIDVCGLFVYVFFYYVRVPKCARLYMFAWATSASRQMENTRVTRRSKTRNSVCRFSCERETAGHLLRGEIPDRREMKLMQWKIEVTRPIGTNIRFQNGFDKVQQDQIPESIQFFLRNYLFMIS